LNNTIIGKNSYRFDKFDAKIAENRQKWRQKNATLGNFCFFMKKNIVFAQNLVFSPLTYITSLRKMESLSLLRRTLLRSMAQSLSRSMVSLGTVLTSLNFDNFFQAIIHALSQIFRFPAALVHFLSSIRQKLSGPQFDTFRQMITLRIT
jgi:hypothetical protein